ncbi:MAG TPA: hypothetical protein VG407_03990 [Caulobacteraceae bacterium]|jgi:hypothetical protein|nr:hypothetical protein [Caulobacteraceae bacterium]
MKLILALASTSVLLISSVAFSQNQPVTPPTPPAQPATPPAPSQPAAPTQPTTPAPAPPATTAAPSTMPAPTYGKGWNAKKCADAKAKGKTIPAGACPAEPAPK